MNDLSKDMAEVRQRELEKGASSSSATEIRPAPGQDTARFFVEFDDVRNSIDDLQKRLLNVQTLSDAYIVETDAIAIIVMKDDMDKEFNGFCTTAREVRGKLEALGKSNAANRKIMNCQAGSSTDLLRIGVTSDLKKRLRELAIAIEGQGKAFQDRYRRVVELKLYLATGQHVDESGITYLLKTRDSQWIIRNAIVEPGPVALEAIAEIHERHAKFKDFETRLQELHQIFLDMGIYVESQGEPVDIIEPKVDPESHPEVPAGVPPGEPPGVPPGVPPEGDLQVDQGVDHCSNFIFSLIIFCILGFIFCVVVLVRWKKTPK